MKALLQLNRLFRAGKHGFSATLVLAMLAAFLPQTVLAATNCQSYYTFRPGVKTPSISQYYGLKWKAIAAANGMKANEKPSVGRVLCIPALSTNPKPAATTSTTFRKGAFLPTNEQGAVFSVSITNHQINTTLSNFSYYHAYQVKVRDVRTVFGGWYKLGEVTVITLARQSFSFAVPDQLKGTTYLSVCFKDQVSEEITCRNALNR